MAVMPSTRLLMQASALLMAALGLAATFLPQEIMRYAAGPDSGLAVVMLQVMGALYVGFALLNWMARGNLIGGIYSRPVAVGNLAHFLVAALALGKAVLAGHHAPALVAAAIVYAAFAALFARVVLRPPPAATPGP
ncbi:MAG: hypothetical protein U1F48_00130 [Burkholderiales bacterium]